MTTTSALPPIVKREDNSISPPKIALIMGIALQMSLILTLQPLFLKALVLEGRLALDQVGIVAALELGGIGLTVTLAMIRLRPDNLVRIIAPASILFCIANIVTAYAPTPFIMAARLVSGCCSGMFLWLLAGMMTRSTLPARMNGIWLASQGIVGLIVSALLANIIAPRMGATGCFLFLAALGALATLGSFGLPLSYARIESHRAGILLPTGNGFLALGTIFALGSGIFGAWILLPLLSLQFGYPVSVTSVGLPLSIGMQVAGGLAAAALAARLSYRYVLPGAMLVFMTMLALLLSAPGPLPAVLVYMVYGFLWTFYSPFSYSYALEIDPSRASVMFLGPAQLLGAGTGPMIASLGVSGNDVRGAVAITIVLIALAMGLFGLTMNRRKGS